MSNFFSLYEEYNKDTEPAKVYQFWSAVSIVSNLLGKKVWFPMGHFNIFPNQYLLFVGPPGNRKTTAESKAEEIFTLTKVSSVADTSSTSESIIETMSSTKARVRFNLNGHEYFYQQYSPYCSEFSTFLGGKHLSENVVRFLTDIYDRGARYKYKTKNKGEYEILNPFFSFLGCGTMDWFFDNVRGGLISSGFTRRILFIYSNKFYQPYALPELPKNAEKLLSSMLIECSSIAKISGAYTFTPEAKEIYLAFYPDMLERANNTNTALGSYFSTKHVHVIKLCMALSAGLGLPRIINSQVIQLALKALSDIEQHYEFLFQSTGKNELKRHQDALLARIRETPSGILSSYLLSEFYGNLRQNEYTECIEVLIKSGQISAQQKTKNGILDTLLICDDSPDPYQDYPILENAAKLEINSETCEELNLPYPIQLDPTEWKDEPKPETKPKPNPKSSLGNLKALGPLSFRD